MSSGVILGLKRRILPMRSCRRFMNSWRMCWRNRRSIIARRKKILRRANLRSICPSRPCSHGGTPRIRLRRFPSRWGMRLSIPFGCLGAFGRIGIGWRILPRILFTPLRGCGGCPAGWRRCRLRRLGCAGSFGLCAGAGLRRGGFLGWCLGGAGGRLSARLLTMPSTFLRRASRRFLRVSSCLRSAIIWRRSGSLFLRRGRSFLGPGRWGGLCAISGRQTATESIATSLTIA